MGNGPSEAEKGEEHSLLIPGIPDEVAVLCLVRVPRRHHHNLQGVCRRWRELVHSDFFCGLRKRLGLSEAWVYALSRDNAECLHWHVLDPVQRRWKELSAMPSPCARRYGMTCEVIGRKLYLIGGCGRFEDPTGEVHVFDPLRNAWSTAAPMDNPRCHFVSGSLDGKLYVIGGEGLASRCLSSWEIYDFYTNKWESHENPNIIPDLGESLVMDNKIYVRHISPTNLPPVYAAVYNPVDNDWTELDNEMTRRWYGPTVVIDNNAYMVDQSFGIKLMTLDKESMSWIPVGRISPFTIRTPCRMATMGHTLVLVGKGLKTLVIDMGKVSKLRGFLVSSSIKGLEDSDRMIINCCSIEV